MITKPIKFSQISTDKWRAWTTAENGLRASFCGSLSSSVSQDGYSGTPGAHSACFTAVCYSLELWFSTQLFNIISMKKWECHKIQWKSRNSRGRGRAMGSGSQAAEAESLLDKLCQSLRMISSLSWLNCRYIVWFLDFWDLVKFWWFIINLIATLTDRDFDYSIGD